MANIYVRSAAGGTPDGTTWATAWLTLGAAMTGATNADTIWLASDHDEATGAAVTIACPTSAGLKILSSDTTVTEPPTGLSTTAVVAVGVASAAINIRGHAYFYGIIFKGGTNSSAACLINLADGVVSTGQIFDSCKFELLSASAVSVNFGVAAQGGTDDVLISMSDCTVKFGATTQSLTMRHSKVRIQGLTVDAAGSIPTSLIVLTAGTPSDVLIEASDLSGTAFTNLVSWGFVNYSEINLRNCKLPAGINVTTGTNPGAGGPRVTMMNCDSADTSTRYAVHRWQGSSVTQTGTLIRTGGATQADTVVHSIKMVGTANSTNLWIPLESPEFSVFNTAVGSAKTATVEILRDNVTALKDNEIWLEVMYLGTSGVPKGTVISDRMTNVLSTAANQTSSAVTWDTTGMTNANKQKLEVTFTPQEAGYLIARVMLAANTTVYVDPYITIS